VASQEEVRAAWESMWLEYRQLARTDLIFLCNKVLGYQDVCDQYHGGIIKNLQKFQGGTDTLPAKVDGSHYKPFIPNHYNLYGPRDTMSMFFREGFKSTVVSVAHTIQWIINYPNIRILISTATSTLGESLIGEIERHFRTNETFRALFPELCPQGNVMEWGNMQEFTIACGEKFALANEQPVHKEPTVSMLTTGSIMAGGHFDVHKYDDMVDDKNTQTPEQIAVMQRHFNQMVPLLYRCLQHKMTPEVYAAHGNSGWRDIVGTRYHFADLYGSLIEANEKSESPMWSIYVQGALKKGRSIRDPEAEAFWPEKISLKYLKQIEAQPGGYAMVNSQYLLNPVPDSSGLVESADQIKFIPRKVLNEILPSLRLHCTIDLHGMEVGKATSDNDYTVMTICGFGRDGRPYIVEIRRGRFTPHEVIENIFKLYQKYPNCIDFKMEKDAHARVLLPFLQREKERRQRFPNVIPIQRDNRTSKQHRIRGMQAWFVNGDIRFAEDLPCKSELINEIMFFPKYKHDDILDTLADHMQNAEGEVTSDVLPRPLPEGTVRTQDGSIVPARVFQRFLGFGPNGEPQFTGQEAEQSNYYAMTGTL
jgi:predicted phage terminase large subunit-like protein